MLLQLMSVWQEVLSEETCFPWQRRIYSCFVFLEECMNMDVKGRCVEKYFMIFTLLVCLMMAVVGSDVVVL